MANDKRELSGFGNLFKCWEEKMAGYVQGDMPGNYTDQTYTLPLIRSLQRDNRTDERSLDEAINEGDVSEEAMLDGSLFRLRVQQL